jgi:hypothetical protein
MFDMSVYFNYELERTARSSGCDDETRSMIKEELMLRKKDKTREPVNPQDEVVPHGPEKVELQKGDSSTGSTR